MFVLAGACRAEDDYSLKSARAAHDIKAVRDYLRFYPKPNRQRAHKLIEELRKEARAQLVDRTPFETRPVVLALVDWLAEHDTETVALVIREPAAADVAAIDAALAPEGTAESPVAPLASVFRAHGAPDYALTSGIDKTMHAIFPNGVVSVERGGEGEVAAADAPVIEIGYRLKATGALYHLAVSTRQFVGVAADFDFTLRVPGQAPMVMSVVGMPGESITLATDMFSTVLLPQYPTSDAADGDVYEAMLAKSYDRLAERLEERLTGKAAARPREKTHVEAAVEMCEHGDDGACVEAADALVAGTELPKDLKKALAYYQRGCGPKPVPHACVRAAKLMLMGEGLPHDADGAQSTASEACPENLHGAGSDDDPTDATDVEACLLYAQIALRDPEVAPYLPPPGRMMLEGPGFAELAWKRACRAGHAPSCVRVAELATNGYVEPNGEKVAADPAKAAEYRALACRAGDGASCAGGHGKR